MIIKTVVEKKDAKGRDHTKWSVDGEGEYGKQEIIIKIVEVLLPQLLKGNSLSDAIAQINKKVKSIKNAIVCDAQPTLKRYEEIVVSDGTKKHTVYVLKWLDSEEYPAFIDEVNSAFGSVPTSATPAQPAAKAKPAETKPAAEPKAAESKTAAKNQETTKATKEPKEPKAEEPKAKKNNTEANAMIEKLFGVSLVDGEITEKEQQIITAKAVEAGAKADEFKILLDYRVYLSKHKDAKNPLEGKTIDFIAPDFETLLLAACISGSLTDDKRETLKKKAKVVGAEDGVADIVINAYLEDLADDEKKTLVEATIKNIKKSKTDDLIVLALVRCKCKVSDADRATIINVAKKAGEDPVVFEMMLDAKIYEILSKDPFAGTMVKVDADEYTQSWRYTYWYWYHPGGDRRKKQEGKWSASIDSRKVKLSDFKICKYQVTQAQWKMVMGVFPAPQRFEGDDLPVHNVNWEDIQQFLAKLNQLTGKNYKLPTEAQWEFAARGGAKTHGYKYAGSDSIDDVAWYVGNYVSTLHPVGKKKPNELGLYDMTGNVWEWCQDLYEERHGTEDVTDPTGPTSGSYRVKRGGSCGSHASDCEVWHRSFDKPEDRDNLYGFRLAL